MLSKPSDENLGRCAWTKDVDSVMPLFHAAKRQLARLGVSWEDGTPFPATADKLGTFDGHAWHNWIQSVQNDDPEGLVALTRFTLTCSVRIGEIDSPGDSAFQRRAEAPQDRLRGHGKGIGDAVEVQHYVDVNDGQRRDPANLVARSDEGTSEASRVEHAVILIHGIRSFGAWYQVVNRSIGSNTVRVTGPKFGWFPAIRFIFPRDMSAQPMDRVYREIMNARRTFPNAKISVIAHSFGTHLLTKILETYPDITLWRVILCGSVVKQDFRWDKVFRQIGPEDEPDKARYIVNDCGNRDSLPVLGAFAGRRYGNAGTDGFGSIYVTDRFHYGGHGLFFDQDFISRYWQPFIERGELVDGPATQGDRIPRRIRVIQALCSLGLDLWATLVIVCILSLAAWYFLPLAANYWWAHPRVNPVSYAHFVAELANAREQGSVAVSDISERYKGDKVRWRCTVIDVLEDNSYRIGLDRTSPREDQAIARFSDPKQFNPNLKGHVVVLEGTFQSANVLGIVLTDCTIASRSP